MDVSYLQSLYDEVYKDKPGRLNNLHELAIVLSNIVKREKPWSGIYLNNLLKGYDGFRITPELERAINALAGRLDSQPPLQALITKEVKVYSINGLEEGSIVLAHSRRCLNCLVLFVPVVHNQTYCCKECKKMARKERERNVSKI